MFIIIKDNYLIKKITLDEYYLYKGIEIYLKNDRYYINLKDNYFFVDNTKSSVLDLQKYEIHIKDLYYTIEIYVYELGVGIDDFNLYENTKILIANNEKANIITKDYYLNDYYLYLDNGFIQTNFDISVNGLAYDNYSLNDGDIIEYLGIKLIYFSDYIYINSFNCLNNIKEYIGNECVLRYPDVISIPNYYIPSDLVELKIKPIDKYVPPKQRNTSEFIKSIIPNIIMSLSMSALASISFLSSLQNKQAAYTRISYVLMPISMFITGIIVPLCFYLYDQKQYLKEIKNTKSKYLEYLSNYEQELKDNISRYLDSNNDRYFDLESIKKRMFYAGKNSPEYMKLSLGKVTISKSITYANTGDKDIDDLLSKINEEATNIKDFPLFLNLKDNRIITIVCKNIDKLYFFNKFLLELAYKHHYDDICLAVYSNNPSVFDPFFNLPHLSMNRKRQTLINEKQIQELNQNKLDKPLVLFLFDYIDFTFTNKNIYVLYLSTDIKDLYKDSDCVIEYLNNKGYLYKDNKQEFSFVEKRINFNDYYAYLGRLKSYIDKEKAFHFRDVFSMDIKQHYLNQNTTLTCDFAYHNDEKLSFDLHEMKQGPHGLIGGCTGSGKSELIISMLLALCIRYSPEYLNIVLIDYKGGGIKESLSYKNITIPHIVAAVSNLENNALERLIICLNNECKHRQELFKTLSRLSSTSIMNLDDYLSGNYNRYGLDKIAHLLIVVDEFAELKKEHPEQIKELISLSRIGRSLGLHLLLATQKPSGIIDEEIWSNSHFKIALKVFDEKDSMDIIKRNDAAYLNKAGAFLLQVDDSLIKANSIYSKCDINNKEAYQVSLLDNTLECTKVYKQQQSKINSECSMFCQKIIVACNELGLMAKPLSFLPAHIKARKQLTKSECLVFGEGDDYLNTKRSLVAYNIDESILLYSTRLEEINSFLNTFNEFKRNCVVIANKKYEGPYISDSLLYDEEDDINYLFNYLLNHKELNITMVIEDLNCLLSYDDTYLDKLINLCRRSKTIGLGLFFITTNCQISYKLINNFKKRVLIDINDKSDVSLMFNARSRYEGKSFYFNDEPISMVPVALEKYVSKESLLEPLVKRIPNIIEPLIDGDKYLIGYNLVNKEMVFSDANLLIVSMDDSMLERYRNAYHKIKTCIYTHELKFDSNIDLLWLGPGIFNQRLFIASNKDDLKSDEGLYIEKGRKYLIRSLSYV